MATQLARAGDGMVLINYAGREINAKIVYYGPGLSGKTTNLECIYASVPGNSRGKMVSMKTRQDRTLFFDFLPLELGQVHGFRTRFLLYTVPGQVFYNATRKLVLKGADAVVFVADSQRGKMDDNAESLRNLEENLVESNLSLDSIPWVIQYNKRDLADVYSVDELQRALNERGVPCFEAAAATGAGVYETLHAVSKMLFQRLVSELKTPGSGKAAGTTRPPATTRSQAAPPAAPARRGWQPAPVQRPGRRPERETEPSAPLQTLTAREPNLLGAKPAPFAVRGGNVPAEPTSEQILHSVHASTQLHAGPEQSEGFEQYGHIIDLEVPKAPDGFIKDPLRTPQSTRQPESIESAPAATYRVPVVVSQADFKAGNTIRLVVELRVEP